MIFMIIVSVLWLLYYVGAFAGANVSIGESPFGSMTIAYKYYRDFALNVDDAFRALVELCPGRQLLTIYYDNPADYTLESNTKIRFCVACVIREEGDSGAADDKSKEADEELLRKLIEKGYSELKLPKVKRALNGQYPFTCSASVAYAERRVLGAISEIVKEQKVDASPIIELCSASKLTIFYVAPLEHNEDFKFSGLDDGPLAITAENAESEVAQNKKDD